MNRARLQMLAWPLALVLTTMIVAAGFIFWLKKQINQTDMTSNTSSIQIVIGDDALNIPQNLFRFERQRKKLSLKQADLVLLWPEGSGFDEASAEEFEKTENLLFITLKKRKQNLDMSSRFEPIYKKLLDGSRVNGPADLTLYGFKSGVGYDGELLAAFVDDQKTWVARCYPQSKTEYSNCIRDLHLGRSLSVHYRFSSEHLANWREIEQLVVGKLEPMIKQ